MKAVTEMRSSVILLENAVKLNNFCIPISKCLGTKFFVDNSAMSRMLCSVDFAKSTLTN